MSKSVVLRDLARSGLTAGDAKKLHIKALTPSQVTASTGFDVAGASFPYFDFEGQLIRDYQRIRLFWPSEWGGDSSSTKDKPKYIQPPGSQLHAYLAPFFNWAKLADDTDQWLAITEGEKKAAKGCKSGIPTLGLGGVWSFQQKIRKQTLIPDLQRIKWQERHVFLVFDSDLYENKQVAHALERLEHTLLVKRALVHRVLLPDTEEMIVGLDDFLVAQKDPKAAYKALLTTALEDVDPVHEAVLAFGEQCVLVREASAAYDLQTRQLMTRTKLRDSYATQKVVTFTTNGFPKERPLSEVWWESPLQRNADRISLRPEHPPGEIIEESDGRSCLNIFQGMGVEPKKGDTKLWQTYLRQLLPTEMERVWFERWLAFPLQHPGTKLYTTPFLWGKQGAGKSFIGSFMARIYGPSYRILKTDMLFGSFNSWASGALFVMADDLSSDNTKQCASTLKLYVAGNQIPINAKYQPEYQINNLCQFYLNANNPQALPLEDGQSNRRYFVAEVGTPSQPEKWFTQVLHPWCQGDGASHLYYRLLKLKLGDFDPRAHAPDTGARHEVLSSSTTTVEFWCQSLEEKFGDRQIITFTELENSYRSQTGDRYTRPGVLSYTLKRYITYLGQHSALNVRRSFWALKDGEKWAKKPRAAVDLWVKTRMGGMN